MPLIKLNNLSFGSTALDDALTSSGTYTSTITYNDNETSSSPTNATTTTTGNYVRFGRVVVAWIPTVNRTMVGTSSNFLFRKWTVPFVSDANNKASFTLNGFNVRGRYTGSTYTGGNIYMNLGNNSTTVSTSFNIYNGGSAYAECFNSGGGYSNVSATYIAAE